MSPVAYSLLKFVWLLLAMGAGAVAGAALLELHALAWLGPTAGAAPLLGGAGGVALALLVWERYVWVRCPACGSRMARAVLGGRNVAFKCPLCGRMDRTL